MNLFLAGLRSVAGLSRRQRRSKVVRSQSARAGSESLESRIVLSAITGTVYDDADSSGTKTGPDNTLAGWQVYVDLDNSGTFNNKADGTPEPSAIANGGGDYSINMNGFPTALYRVSEVVQPGWTPTMPASRDVAFIAGEDLNKIDFFNFAGGNIVGTVWNDLDEDGVRATDPGTGAFTEPGLAGWTVFLDLKPVDGGGLNRSLDPGEPSTVTDSLGNYSFSNLPADDYEVTEVKPFGWDVAPTFDIQQTATVVALGTATQDFANFSLLNGSIEGTIWNDLNGDGDRAIDPATGLPTEQGLVDWTVYIDSDTDGVLDATELTATTDANGNYYFVSVLAGSHLVREVLPSNWSASPGYAAQQTVSVTAGEKTNNVDFANFTVLNGSIRGSVWNDVNRDGVRNSSPSGVFSDPGLAGWTVYLDMNRSRTLDTGEPTALTDVNGAYVFPDLQIGEYEIIEIVPTGWETAPTFGDNYAARVFSGAETAAHDFANFNLSTLIPGSVSGVVWNDQNGNGVLDTTPTAEPGLGGRVVFADVNANGILDATDLQTATNADGTYTISGIAPGTISIYDVVAAGWHATSPVTGVRSLVLKNGEHVTGINYGNAEPKNSTISGSVFADTNKNGVRDSGEHGLAGIAVYLDLNSNGALDPTDLQTVTSENLYYTPSVNEAGSYSFAHLASGTYAVRQVIPTVLSSTPPSQFEHTVTMLAAENHSGVDFADVFRPNEIHGVKFDDNNGNHVRDPGEDGVGGTTIFIDSDRDDALDPGEVSTVTLADGSYSFTGLTPGAYVVREVLQTGFGHSYPTTTGGTLWPAGTSNPAQGLVSPASITTSLAVGQSYHQTVSLTLPGTGSLTNAVDVFLLFDDTGSFVNNSPIVRAAFPNIISQLQTSLSGTDLAFGVGRFEEYANFASEYSTGRPFVLNQPIVAASNPGYMTAIQAALNRTTPGYGGDGPETDIEALYQLVTGLGFDGNNNGSVMDSGAAGLGSTQLVPGNSGDVPSFASFTADASAGVLPAAGTVGGAGFRAGALPVILLATDIGFAYQPKGETSVTGVNGLTLPVSALSGYSRASTPFNSGAGLQETITGLNALGALVIGLGTNTQANVDPRQGLEAISKLTGAINRTTTTIANGTADPIAPGDPLYFQISSGFAASVADGVKNAIQNAVTNVAMNITVQASDPRVRIVNHTGTRNGVGSGQTATFDIEFIGDGIPHRFDLQFVRQGTNVVLGSIPVVLGTPIPGDGYHFDDLNEGEIELEDHFGHTSSAATQNLVVSSPTVSVTEGATNTFTVKLSVQPASDVTVTVAKTSGDNDLSGAATLTFTSVNWDTPQSVTLAAAEDIDLANGSAVFSVTSSGLTTVSVTGTEADNDLQSLVVSPTSVSVSEGLTNTFTVKLAFQPSSDISVSTGYISGDTDLSLSGGAALTFTTANWDTPQTVTLAAAEDADLTNGSAVFDVTSTGLAAVSVTATEADNDTANLAPIVSISSTATDGFLGVRGQIRSFTVSTSDSPADLAAGFIYTINWGDGATQTFAAGADTTISHIYETAAVFTVSVIAEDQGMAISLPAATSVSILITELQGTELAVGGTNLNDAFSLTQTSPGTFGVILAGKSVATYAPGLAGSIQLYGNSGVDTLTAMNQSNVWELTGMHSGNLNTQFMFQGIENLKGGTLDDQFRLENGAGFASIDGNSNTGTVDSLDYSSRTTPVIVDLAIGSGSGVTSFKGVESVIGSGSSADTVVGPNLNTAWTISGVDSGKAGVLSFSSFENLVGGSLNDSFKFSTLEASVSGLIQGSGGVDMLTAFNTANLWNLTGVRSGDVNGTSFDSIENLTGGTLGDTFSSTDAATGFGIVNGGTGIDVFDFSVLTSSAVVNLAAGSVNGVASFKGFESVIGSGSSADTVVGLNVNTAWTISGVDSGKAGVLSFSSFENLVGGSLNDSFKFSTLDASVSGLIQGSGGVDTLTAFNMANLWNLTGDRSGNVNGTSFDSIENLTGGTGADTFAASNAFGGFGIINGGTGADLLSFAGMTGGVTVNLQTKAATGMAQFLGFENLAGETSGNDLLVGLDLATTWTITGASSGLAGLVNFQSFENLNGGAADDTFRIQPTGSLSGVASGGDGVNVLDYSFWVASGVTVDLGTGTATGFGGVSGITIVIGSAQDDALTGDGGDNILIGGAGNDVLNGIGGRDMLFGGSGTDVLHGGAGDDLLFGGKISSYNEATKAISLPTLKTIRTKWTGAAPYADRVSSLLGAELKSSTLIDDALAIDQLFGDSENDWFLTRLGDVVADAAAETITAL